VKINIKFYPDILRDKYLALISPVIDFFIKRGVNPNFFTTVGLIIAGVATYFLASGSLRTGGILILLGGTFDIIDGRVARATNRVTKFGALYDSTLDRYGEVMIFFGLAYYFTKIEFIVFGYDVAPLIAVAISVAIGGAIMTSYVRARAEGLGFECKVGIMQRPERVVFIGFGTIIHEYVLILAIILIAILANFTAIQRLYHVWQTERQ